MNPTPQQIAAARLECHRRGIPPSPELERACADLLASVDEEVRRIERRRKRPFWRKLLDWWRGR